MLSVAGTPQKTRLLCSAMVPPRTCLGMSAASQPPPPGGGGAAWEDHTLFIPKYIEYGGPASAQTGAVARWQCALEQAAPQA